jgi:uncharacterized protein
MGISVKIAKMNTISYFEIQADDPKRAVNFYKDLFGWEGERDESLPIEYWRLKTPGIAGAILKRPAKALEMSHGTNAFTCSVEVENFDQTSAKILELGGQIALEKFAIPGTCWQGYFIDTEGNTFGIFEVDEHAK